MAMAVLPGLLVLVGVFTVVTAESPVLLDSGELGEAGVGDLLAKVATAKKAGPLIPRASEEYTKIPNFVYPGTPVKVKNMELCKKKCDSHTECRSFSFKSRGKKCFWSTGSLRYNHKWDFFSKEFDLDAFGRMVPTEQYNKFQGLFAIDSDQNMKTLTGKSLSGCKQACNDAKTCLSFSYHDGDRACLMGISKVKYSAGWVYFERNKKPATEGGKWLPYPLRLDAYHRKQQREETKTLRLFAERDTKIRLKKKKKKEIVQKKMVYMQKKTERLNKEAKVKMFAREQHGKKVKARKAEQKEDMDAAREKGKFDEAYHKQAEKNKELLHKRKMEGHTKQGIKEMAQKKQALVMKKFAAHLTKIKERGMKEITKKNRVTTEKEKSVKLKRSERAQEVKNDAFQLVLGERKFKSSVKNTKRVKNLKKKVNSSRRKMWEVADRRNASIAAEKESKRQMNMAKAERRVKLKLMKEKLGKRSESQPVLKLKSYKRKARNTAKRATISVKPK